MPRPGSEAERACVCDYVCARGLACDRPPPFLYPLGYQRKQQSDIYIRNDIYFFFILLSHNIHLLFENHLRNKTVCFSFWRGAKQGIVHHPVACDIGNRRIMMFS